MSDRFRRSAVAVVPMHSTTRSFSRTQLSEQEGVEYELLSVLEKQPDLSQRELSKQLGISLGRVNYCLQALAEKGWVKLENFRQSPHKQRYIYALTPTGIAERSAMTGRFLKRKLAEFEHLKAQIAILERELPERDLNERDLNERELAEQGEDAQ